MRAWFCLLTFVSTLGVGTARAQGADEATRTAARALGTAGVEAYEEGDYRAAGTKLEKAFEVLAVPTLGLWSARTRAKLGRLVEAAERYQETIALQLPSGDVAVQRQAQADAQAELDELRPKIPSVVIRVAGAEANEVTLSLDGKPLSSTVIGKRWLVNPGVHSIVATRGAEEAKAEVTLAEGQSTAVALQLSAPGSTAPTTVAVTPEPLTEPAPSRKEGDSSASTSRLLGWSVLGLGAVGLAVGGVTGVMALGTSQELDEGDRCAGQTCAGSERDKVDRVNTLRTVSMLGLYAGGALAATGVVLLVVSSPKSDTQVGLRIAPNAAFVSGAF